jgi:predicted acetyltransferase
MEEIRRFTMDDFDQGAALSEFAFQYELNDREREERRSRFKPEEYWGYFVDGRLAAKLAILDLETWIQGRRMRMGGIASVSTWPEYRRKGLVAQLLAHALRVMKEQGQVFSALNPFSFAFYRKYGWELFVERLECEIPQAMLPNLPPYAGRFERVQPERELKLLQRLYEAYAVRYSGTMPRSEAWWKERVLRPAGGTAAVYRDEAGEPRAYVLYRVKERTLKVFEMVFLDERARMAVWKFLANHDSMLDKVTLTAPSGDKLAFLFENPRFPRQQKAFYMGRIVDVKAFLEQYPFLGTGRRERFVLQIGDAHAPWNHGVFELAVGPDGRAAVSAPAPEAADRTPALSCSIQTLTVLLAGYQQAADLHAFGRLAGAAEEAQRLQALLPARPTFLMDSF